MGVLSENAIIGASAAGGYDIDYSCRFNAPDTPYLERTPSAGNRKTWTVSFWIKLTKNDTSTYGCIWSSCPAAASLPGDVILVETGDANWRFWIDNSSQGDRDCTAVARDPAAWYHIVCYFDSPNQTMGIYVNGELQTDMRATGNPALNYDSETFDGSTPIRIGEPVSTRSGDDCLNMYLAEFHMVEGLALAASDFGETDEDTNEWKPIKYAGSYGNEGFYLKFEDAANLGNDSSGNGNDFTSSGLAASDQMLDTPTNNFNLFNSVFPIAGGYNVTWAEGNLKMTMTTGGKRFPGTFIVPILDGNKWYFEYIKISGSNAQGPTILLKNNTAEYDNQKDFQWQWNSADGIQHNTLGSNTVTTVDGTSFSSSDVIGIFIDGADIKFYKNNTLTYTASGAITVGNSTHINPAVFGADSAVMAINFGQDSSFAGERTAQGNADSNGIGDFYYAPPAGALAMCSKNLSDPSIALPDEHFVTTLVSGNGAARSITGLSFQPDFLWGKSRTNTLNHYLTDSVRGINKQLYSDTYTSENSETVIYTAFNSDGFSLGTGDMNLSGQNYVHWAWKGGGTAVSNSDGSITSSVSANTTAGFSVVGWTGTGSNATVGHGLSQAPEIVINKSRPGNTSTYQWAVQSLQWVDASDTNLLYLNTDAAWADDTNVFQAAPTASVFSPQGGAWGGIGAAEDYIAYCFHSVEGYSKVGQYVGNGDANGTFVYTGFRPAYIMVKHNGTNDWRIFDNKRDPLNVGYRRLQANLNYAEGTESWNEHDFVSNGFKWRVSDGGYNGTNAIYLYIAFAESPFKTARAR